MTLAEMIKSDRNLKAQFDRIVELEAMADSIDYIDSDVSQERIDDHTLVNGEFTRAIENFGITPAQYYETKKPIAPPKS